MRAALLVVVLLLTGCGVPQDSRPRALEPAEAPFSLPSATPVERPAGPGRVTLYFVRDGAVVPTSRPVLRSVPDRELLVLLLAGPTPEELADGTSSLLPASITIEDVRAVDGVAVVTLGGPEDQVASTQPPAFAQIVATLTAPGRFRGVRFRLDGQDLDVPRGDGSLSSEPLDRGDYAELLAPPTPRPS